MKNTTEKDAVWCKVEDAYNAMLTFADNPPTLKQFIKQIEKVRKLKPSKMLGEKK